MPKLTDPMDGLRSFQEYLPTGALELQPGRTDPSLFVHLDSPAGEPRLTYVRLEGEIVAAFVVAVMAGREDGLPVFQLGYAVPEVFRGQGRAKKMLAAAVAELTQGLGRNGVQAFFIEAVIASDNEASQRVAASVFTGQPKVVTDSLSGTPCFQYMQRIEAA